MNKIEQLKSQQDPMDIVKDIARFAEEGWESISEEDVQRLKWHGLFLRKPTPGYFMLRVRISNGFTFSHQVKMLARISQEFGNGVIDFTTRQQVQIRHLRIEDILKVFGLLDSVGLNSLQTGMDNVRNILGCPVAGYHPRERIDASPLVKALTQHILENREFTNLPRKFNVVITGCPDNCIHTETQDLALVPAEKEVSGNTVVGFNIFVGGKLGSGGYRIASPLDMFVMPEEVVEVCAAIILMYRDHGNREVRTQNRLSFLVDEWGVERFRAELSRRLERPLTRAGADARSIQKADHLGIYRQKQFSMNYVGLKISVGRVRADQLQLVAEAAEKYGTGEIRISPAQTLIIPNVSDKKLGHLLEEPLLKDLRYAPSNIMRNLVSCVGKDYCSLAAIETKSRAVEVAQDLEKKLESVDPISMHWSGCPAGCGNHLVSDVGFLGKRIKVNGDVVDAVDIFVGGRAGPYPKQAIKIMENVPCDKLSNLLEWVLPYHTRDKMHPIKKSKLKSKKLEKEKSLSGTDAREDMPKIA